MLQKIKVKYEDFGGHLINIYDLAALFEMSNKFETVEIQYTEMYYASSIFLKFKDSDRVECVTLKNNHYTSTDFCSIRRGLQTDGYSCGYWVFGHIVHELYHLPKIIIKVVELINNANFSSHHLACTSPFGTFEKFTPCKLDTQEQKYVRIIPTCTNCHRVVLHEECNHTFTSGDMQCRKCGYLYCNTSGIHIPEYGSNSNCKFCNIDFKVIDDFKINPVNYPFKNSNLSPKLFNLPPLKSPNFCSHKYFRDFVCKECDAPLCMIVECCPCDILKHNNTASKRYIRDGKCICCKSNI